MQSKGTADKPASLALPQEEGAAIKRKRLRPRWQRWLLWSAVRLLLLAGVGVGVGTIQRRVQTPDLMAHARRIASIANANGYYWTPKGELRLYRYVKNGTASLRWNQSAQSATFVEMLPKSKGRVFADPMQDVGPHVQSVGSVQNSIQMVQAYNQRQNYTPGKRLPKPDYTWKIKVMPTLPASLFDAVLSPDGKRVAYMCTVPRKDWRDVILQRIRPSYRPPLRGQGAAILVSAVDGSSTTVLGTMKDVMPCVYSRYARSGKTASLQGLFWCPDGKHVSFEYGDGVYAVPVP